MPRKSKAAPADSPGDAPPPAPNVSGRVGVDAAGEEAKAASAEDDGKKVKRGRPIKADQPMSPEQAKAMTEMIVGVIVKPPLQKLAHSFDPVAEHVWPNQGVTFALTEMEEMQLRVSVEACCLTIPYIWLAKWIPWIALGMCSAEISVSRVIMALQLRSVIKAMQAEGAPDVSGAASTGKSGDDHGGEGKRKDHAREVPLGSMAG